MKRRNTVRRAFGNVPKFPMSRYQLFVLILFKDLDFFV
jgi:hypothetical protein